MMTIITHLCSASWLPHKLSPRFFPNILCGRQLFPSLTVGNWSSGRGQENSSGSFNHQKAHLHFIRPQLNSRYLFFILWFFCKKYLNAQYSYCFSKVKEKYVQTACISPHAMFCRVAYISREAAGVTPGDSCLVSCHPLLQRERLEELQLALTPSSTGFSGLCKVEGH